MVKKLMIQSELFCFPIFLLHTGNPVIEWQKNDNISRVLTFQILAPKGCKYLREKLKYSVDVIAYYVCCRMLFPFAFSTGN